MKLVVSSKKDMKKIKTLYNTAFPKDERTLPFFIMKNKVNMGKAKMLSLYDDEDNFAGFAYLIEGERAIYLSFLAINYNGRGKGMGTFVLKELKKIYAGKPVFLALETLDENAENYAERVKRHNFYLKAGLVDLPYIMREKHVIYMTMGTDVKITPDDYNIPVNRFLGFFWKKFVNTEMY